MNILFIGSIYSDGFKEILKKNNLPVSSAGQTFQRALLNGLDRFCDVRVISEYFVPTFPRIKEIRLSSEKFSHNNAEPVDESISFLNLPGIKKFSQLSSYYKCVKENVSWADVIIVYEATSRQLLAPVLAAKHKPKIVVVPDLPEFMSDNHNPFYLFAKKIDKSLINYALRKFDGYVLLSNYMKDCLNIGEQECLIIEGIFDTGDCLMDIGKDKRKIILYTGKIEKWFGLEDLLQAFTKVKGADVELWLCGPGDIDMVNRYTEKDSRIKYKGCLSHEEVLKYQKKATLLINPRHSSDEFTLYSFPSKTMEYMASGTPTLMCKLKSLPDEYLNHLYLFDDETIDGFANKIQECLSLSDDIRDNFGNAAAEFILNNKNSIQQAKRLVEYLKNIIHG